MSAAALVSPMLRARTRRVAGLLAFASLFLAAALLARSIARPEHGQVEMDPLFLAGGAPLVSSLLLLGWLLGRFPLIATLVLMAGLFSADRHLGYARLFAVRPVPLVAIYGLRWLTLAGVAFILSAVLLPLFDVIMLGTWAGPATLVLIAANILVFGGLTALLSVWTRGDAWLVLLLAILALVWSGVRSTLEVPLTPLLRDAITLLLPPQSSLLALENAFGDVEPIPWRHFGYTVLYGCSALLLAGASVWRREI